MGGVNLLHYYLRWTTRQCIQNNTGIHHFIYLQILLFHMRVIKPEGRLAQRAELGIPQQLRWWLNVFIYWQGTQWIHSGQEANPRYTRNKATENGKSTAEEDPSGAAAAVAPTSIPAVPMEAMNKKRAGQRSMKTKGSVSASDLSLVEGTYKFQWMSKWVSTPKQFIVIVNVNADKILTGKLLRVVAVIYPLTVLTKSANLCWYCNCYSLWCIATD